MTKTSVISVVQKTGQRVVKTMEKTEEMAEFRKELHCFGCDPTIIIGNKK